MIKNKLIVIVSFILGLISILLIVGGILLNNNDNIDFDIDKNGKDVIVKQKMYVCSKSVDCSDRTCISNIRIEINFDDSNNVTDFTTIIESKYNDVVSYNGMVEFFKKNEDSSKYSYNNKDKMITMKSKEIAKGTLIEDLIISYKDNGYKCNIEEY